MKTTLNPSNLAQGTQTRRKALSQMADQALTTSGETRFPTEVQDSVAKLSGEQGELNPILLDPKSGRRNFVSIDNDSGRSGEDSFSMRTKNESPGREFTAGSGPDISFQVDNSNYQDALSKGVSLYSVVPMLPQEFLIADQRQ